MSKAALITGGAKRIGKKLALALASRSYDIALHFNSSVSEAQETASQIREYGVKCTTFRCDLAVEEELLSLIPRAVEEFPELEILINNASIFQKGTILESEPVFFDRHLAINFKAPYFLSRDFARVCKQGQIINILDTRIARNDFSYAVYTLSKKALSELTKISAREFAPGIRVNGIAPGIILPPPDKSEDYLDKLAARIPLRKKGDLDSVIESLNFLLLNKFVTGQFIYVDGGENLE
ncbi:MAG TPA: SDR family oxidoreductase [archaeon]|nr:SDR family oxidoreductase [archaeon]